MGGVGNGAAEENWPWDLNPGAAAMPDWDHLALARVNTIRLSVLPFTTWLRKQERLCLEEKG